MTVTAPDMMIAPALDTQPNRLLAALPAADFERLLPHLERVPLALGKVLYEPGERLAHAYFPTPAVVSSHYVMASGASTAIVGVGNDGKIGRAPCRERGGRYVV